MSEYIEENINRCEMTNGRKNFENGNVIIELEVELDTSNIPTNIAYKLAQLIQTAPELLGFAELIHDLQVNFPNWWYEQNYDEKLDKILAKAKGDDNV